jgi:hypothetical protein
LVRLNSSSKVKERAEVGEELRHRLIKKTTMMKKRIMMMEISTTRAKMKPVAPSLTSSKTDKVTI